MEILLDRYSITKDKVFFFDMDGTLVNTDFANFLSYKEAVFSVTKSSHNLTYDSNKRFNRGMLKNAVPNLAEIEYERIIQEKEKFYHSFLHETILNKEIVDILLEYSKTNITTLVTHCREDRALKTLNHFNLLQQFNVAFYREFSNDGKKINKYVNAVSKLGVLPSLVIAFENEELEIADANQAGIEIINPIII